MFLQLVSYCFVFLICLSYFYRACWQSGQTDVLNEFNVMNRNFNKNKVIRIGIRIFYFVASWLLIICKYSMTSEICFDFYSAFRLCACQHFNIGYSCQPLIAEMQWLIAEIYAVIVIFSFCFLSAHCHQWLFGYPYLWTDNMKSQ